MNVLVTGANGCLGQLVVASLRDREDTTVWTSGRGRAREARYVECDLFDAAAIDALIETTRPEVIFQLAGSLTGDYAKDLAVNAECARHILDATRRRGMRPRTVLIGSAAEYGRVEPDENPVNEERVLRPVSLYGATKAYQTLLASLYSHQYGMDVVVARLFNLFASGVSERLFVGSVEHQIEQLKRGQRDVIELGNLSAERDYISGTDAIEQLLLIATRGSAGEVYNVGSGNPVRMQDLLARMLERAGLDMSVVRENSPTAVRSGYDVPVIYADISKTTRLNEKTSLIRAWP
jgi:GDP-4-dehydro-6-deoxy-D-mannose reductase